jgi:outer membrane protein assembly factor BamE (lipoprotein component of BamABCDE complex)
MRALVGMSVIWTYKSTKTITTITSTSREGFKISGHDYVFNYNNGHQRAYTGRMTSIVSKCELISKEDAVRLQQQWDELEQKRKLVIEITKSLPLTSLSQLQQVINIIKK